MSEYIDISKKIDLFAFDTLKYYIPMDIVNEIADFIEEDICNECDEICCYNSFFTCQNKFCDTITCEECMDDICCSLCSDNNDYTYAEICINCSKNYLDVCYVCDSNICDDHKTFCDKCKYPFCYEPYKYGGLCGQYDDEIDAPICENCL